MAIDTRGKKYTESITGTGSSDWIVCDHSPTSHKYSFLVEVTGTVNYDVEFCITDPSDSPTAISHNELTGETASAAGSLGFPIRGVRITNNSGTGTSDLTVYEA